MMLNGLTNPKYILITMEPFYRRLRNWQKEKATGWLAQTVLGLMPFFSETILARRYCLL